MSIARKLVAVATPLIAAAFLTAGLALDDTRPATTANPVCPTDTHWSPELSACVDDTHW